MKRVMMGVILGFAWNAAAIGPGRRPADIGEIKVLSCTVNFKAKDGMTIHQTQTPGWLLPVKKGKVELKSLGDIKIFLSKDLNGSDPVFRLSVTQGGKSLGEVLSTHTSFEFAAPIKLKIEDGEDGWSLDQVRIACDSTYAAG